MSCDYLERYLWEAEAHANELLGLLSDDEHATLAAAFPDQYDRVRSLLQKPPRTAFVFLGEDPAAQERRLNKLEPGERYLLWLQARYQALQATRAIRLALAAASVKGMKYRKAVRHMAQAALPIQDPPSPEDLLFFEFPG